MKKIQITFFVVFLIALHGCSKDDDTTFCWRCVTKNLTYSWVPEEKVYECGMTEKQAKKYEDDRTNGDNTIVTSCKKDE